jgi:bacillithiol system protein YtxJ
MWNVFGGAEESTSNSWNAIESEEEFNRAIDSFNEKPVVIFKHSTRCGISSAANRRLSSEFDLIKDDVDFYYLDLIKYRSVSNLIADNLSVMHQSPQIILIQDKKAVFHSSHEGVSISAIHSALSQS